MTLKLYKVKRNYKTCSRCEAKIKRGEPYRSGGRSTHKYCEHCSGIFHSRYYSIVLEEPLTENELSWTNYYNSKWLAVDNSRIETLIK